MTRKKTSQKTSKKIAAKKPKKPTTPATTTTTTTADIDAFLARVGYRPDMDPALDARINVLRLHPEDEGAQALLGAHAAAAMGFGRTRTRLSLLKKMYEHWHQRRYH